MIRQRNDDFSDEMLLRPRKLERMKCGGTPVADMESSIGGYRCDECFAIIGSMGQPKRCKEVNND